jgi:hypothetical protein
MVTAAVSSERLTSLGRSPNSARNSPGSGASASEMGVSMNHLSNRVGPMPYAGRGTAKRAERVNARNGYRARPWDTRVGTIDLALPKLRQGTYFPGWLLEPQRRGSGRGTAGRFRLGPADPRCGRLDGKHLPRAWLGKHTSRTPPLGRHHE